MNAQFKNSIICIFLLGAFLSPLQSQQVSAELISKHPPAKLKSGEQVWDGIHNIYLDRGYLYVIDVWAGLQILDISDVKNPKELGAFTTENQTNNIFIDDHYTYLSNTVGGVLLLNTADPKNIKQAGKIKTAGDAYWVTARYPFVYAAEAEKGIHIYDISNLNFPMERGKFETDGWAWSLFLDGDLLYVGDKKKGLIILDISKPETPKQLGVYPDTRDIRSIQVEAGIAYIGDGAKGLLLVNVSNPAQPFLAGQLKIDGYVNNASKSGNSVFLGNDQKRRLDIVNVSDPANPRLEGSYQTKSKIYSALKMDVYVYVAADSQSIILRYNRPPQLSGIGNQVVNENQLLTFRAMGSDPDNDPIEYSFNNMPKGAAFDSLSGLFSWVPDYEQSQLYQNLKITVTEKTISSLSDSEEFTITVSHVNRGPSLTDLENYTVNENLPLVFVIPEGSDEDKEDKGRLFYKAQNIPEGVVFNEITREVSWTPAFTQSGVYPVTFSVNDPAGGIAEKISTITVTHIDRKPVLADVPWQKTNENQLLTFTLEGKDLDAEDQQALSYEAQNLPEGAVFDAASAAFSWTPTYDQSNEYKNLLFIFKAGAMMDSVSVNITIDHVNRAPKLNAVQNQTIDEDKILTFTISGTDDDVEDSGKLVYLADNLPEGAVFNPDSALFSWKPSFEQSGGFKDVVFMIQDPSGLRDSSVIDITVNHINRTPVLAAIEAKAVNENIILAFDLAGTDPDKEDQGKLTYSADQLPEGAVLEATKFRWTPSYDQSGTYTVKFTVTDGQYSDSKEAVITVNHVNRPPVVDIIAAQTVDEDKILTFNVTGNDPDNEDEGKLKISAADMPEGAVFDTTANTFSWTPDFEQAQKYTVKFTITDAVGLIDEKKTDITVNHINRTPVFPEQAAQTIDENQPLIFTLLPAADPDKEDEGKIIYSVKDAPEGAVFDPASQQFTWTPAFIQSGQYTVTFSVTDGAFTVEQPVMITVNHVNRAPKIVQPVEQTVDENTAWSVKIDFSDDDKEDEGKLKITAENIPEGAVFDEAAGTISWTPDFDKAGKYENIKVTVKDAAGLSDEKMFSLTVNNVNRVPALEAIPAVTSKEMEAVNFNLQGTDPDKEDEGKLVFSSDNLPQGASLSADGVFTWIPAFTQAGSFTINFKVTDSGNLSASQTALITVTDVNRAPQLTEPGAKSAKENEELKFNIQGSDEDTDNALTYSAENLPDGASFDASSKEFSWTPSFDQAGDYTVNFKLNDGFQDVTVSAAFTVENINRKPEIPGPSSKEAEEGQLVETSFSASDADNDNLTFSADGLPSGASIDSGSGKISWQTSEGQAGSYSVTVKVSDGQDEAAASLTITITEKPAPPPAPADSTNN